MSIKPDPPRELIEHEKCRQSFAYFANHYCHLETFSQDGMGSWSPFRLWPAQIRVANLIQASRMVIALKARQVGMTWLVLAFALWLMLFYPVAAVMLFSFRDTEAMDLLRRIRGMYDRLPPWLRCKAMTKFNDHEMEISNGSRVKAFVAAGDSYTASLVVIDETELVPHFDRLMQSVKPTVDAGGRMILLSRPNKAKPCKLFRRIWEGAEESGWASAFLPWHSRPDRDAEWYEHQRAKSYAETGAHDALYESYPATAAEALAPAQLNKRIPWEWLEPCYKSADPLTDLPPGAPSIPGLAVYRLPFPRRVYVAGADTAEGNPTSDPSATEMVDYETGEQVAELTGRFEPAQHAAYTDQLCRWYNNAPVLVERNNHGHAALLWMRLNSPIIRLSGLDGKDGWVSSELGKVRMYDAAANAFRHGETIVHSHLVSHQLSQIEGRTLRAPDVAGEQDDLADAFSLALMGRLLVAGAISMAGDD